MSPARWTVKPCFEKAEKAVKNTKPLQSASPAPVKQTFSIQKSIDLAVRHHTAGRLPEAERLYQRILRADPDQSTALHLLGVITHQMGNSELAVDLIAKALVIAPDYADAHSNLALVLKDQGRLDEALASYRKALAIKPDDVEVLNSLGALCQDLGKPDEAIASYGKALAVKPDDADAHNNLGNMFRVQGKLDQAVASYRKALAIAPDDADVLNNLGNALQDLGKRDEALASYHKAIAIDPRHAEAYSNLGAVFQDLGRLDEAITSYHRALAIKPEYARAHSNLLFCMNCDERYSQRDIYTESRRWEAAHAAPGPARAVSHTNDRDPERRLRIGYVSPDFRRHSVSHFLDPLIAGHDRRQFEVFCYAQVAIPDTVTRRFQGLADGWRSTVGMTAPALAERVRGDAIDILVDLAGHTANSRLLAFAERPAPVQVTWLGYPNTTGLSAMDYRLTDAIADPQGPGDALHSETLTRLPGGFLCFAPDAEAPAVADPPVSAKSSITFGSFNNLSKMTVATVAAWARILEGVPGSRLLLKSRSFADAETRRRYRSLFAARGIAEERLELHAWIDSKSGHLGLYQRIDIGLDPFPYNGATTTCEALWMGVPVISLRGDRHAGRVGASILTRVGFSELIADTDDAYVAAAVALAEAPGRLVELRRDLRAAMAASPLCDAAGFTRHVEAAYRGMWRSWCQGA